MYDRVDLRQRRSSSPGYIDSPTYSRQSMSPLLPCSPQHYYRYGKSLQSAHVHVCMGTIDIHCIYHVYKLHLDENVHELFLVANRISMLSILLEMITVYQI